jgi:ketosteroid isomerase-like protein
MPLGAGPSSRTAAALAAAALAACAHPASAPRAGDAATAIMRLDATWASYMARGDGDAFRSYVADDAVFAGRALLRGREEVWAAWKGFFAEGGPRLRWTPVAGGAAPSGDLAWTTGRYRLERSDPAGKPAALEGEYLTVWARDAAGAWRVALDSGLEPAAALEPIERAPVRTLASRDGTLEAAIGTWRRDGPPDRRSGSWITVRERAAGEWRTRFDGALAFPPPR